jgi:hypothetical protein
LAEKDPDLGLKAAEKLTGMSRNPMFLLRLAWAQHAKGEKEKAKATLEEAFQKMEQEKLRDPGSYEENLKELKEAKARFGKG